MNPLRSRHPFLRLRTSWPEPGVVAIALRGDLDSATAPGLAALLTDRLWARPTRVDVDLSEVVFLGVAGLGVLRHAALQAGQTGTELRILAGTNPMVLRALRFAGPGPRPVPDGTRPQPATA